MAKSPHAPPTQTLRAVIAALDAIGQAAFIADAEKRITQANLCFTRITGYAAGEIKGHKVSFLLPDDQGPVAAMWRSVDEHGHWAGEILGRRKDGESVALWLHLGPLCDDTGAITHYLGAFSDITARRESQDELEYRLNHDALTGLPNRLLFQDRLERALARAHRNQLVVGVLFLDLDRFKEVNDSLGHLPGDTLLRQVAERLAASVRRADTVARLSGDEFAVILLDISDFRDAATVAKKILTRFDEPFILDGRPCRITTSIGIGLYPTDGADAATLLQQADEAMYVAKKQGRGCFRFASTDLAERAFQRDRLEAALRNAVDKGGLELHYQPIIALRTGQVEAAEALLRWRHPEIGLMVPGQFLPLARQLHLMPAITAWVLATAFADAVAWSKAGFASTRLCVNIGAVELESTDFPQRLSTLLDAAGLPAGHLDLEIPAAVALGMDDRQQTTLDALRNLGCRVALDDFGAGRADMRTFRKLHVDILKVSPEFIRDVARGGREGKLVRAATTVAHSLQAKVVAKAVETTEQHEFLRRSQCDGAQGYLFSRPLPPTEFLEFLAQSFR